MANEQQSLPVAKQRRSKTMKSVHAEAEAERQLETAFDRSMAEQYPALKERAGKGLIQTVFGRQSIADD